MALPVAVALVIVEPVERGELFVEFKLALHFLPTGTRHATDKTTLARLIQRAATEYRVALSTGDAELREER